MAIDYKKELEKAAKNMILVHQPDTLIKIIVRMIVQKVKVNHAGILLYEKDKNSFILTVSRGAAGLKMPKGFIRMDVDNPLITFFKRHLDREIFGNGAVMVKTGKKILKNNKLPEPAKQILKDTLNQMEIFETEVCIPSYFRDDLLGLLLLGSKRNGRRFAPNELNFFVALASDVAMAIRNALLFRELEFELEKKQKLFIHTTVALAAAIEAKDHYTHGHTTRVTNLSLEIARKLNQDNKKIFDEKFLEDLHIASLLHDIGKIGIPESILNKQGPLDDEERKKMQEHAAMGAIILQPIRELHTAILGVKHHHERYDGLGYPDGLKGEEIPLVASIIAAADSFDAMTSNRPYRMALPKEKAIDEIKRTSGRQFNPDVAGALIELYEKGRI